ncbi:phospholipid phosphatase 3-like isoform X2 [Contarinia nasturtii]|uniref:phospholipid phosphatase 3-like isoform X2 n=1 Tax=Contarinia nasturtii TaxID=265458 RepID=UPI0012D47205|nr:phospholipid phosphatase 3-like isoform X2 [Contarinia nasturtii]
MMRLRNRSEGHDNFGHNISELLEANLSNTGPIINSPNSSATSTSLPTPHFSSQQEIMSPLPMHNRPLMGRRLGLSIDVFIWIFFILWLLVIELGIFPHVKRGFYCDDRSIAMQYNGETVTTGALLFTVLLIYPILWICEACYFVPVSMKSSRFIESARRAWRWFKEFLYGITLHLFVIDGIKVLFGELRPHFLDTCRPDALQTCTGGQYVIDYKCTNDIDSSWFVRDASKSFPSGHSSTSFYEAIFLIWYLQMRTPKIRSKLLIPTLQCVFLLYAFLCSVSRITDHRHHWWDVLAGAKIGIVFASLVCIFLCKNFQTKKAPNVEPMMQNGNTIDHRHTSVSVRRLLTERTKDELNLNHVVVP